MGYTKVALTQGFNAVGVQFCDIGGADKDFSTAVTLDSSFAGYDDDYVFATQLLVWTGNGYNYYGWAGTAGTDVDGDPSLDNTWTDDAAYAVEGETMPASSAAWIIAEKAGTMMSSGEVCTTPVTVQLAEGFNMVANPYPYSVPVTSFGQLDASFAGYDDDYVFGTQLLVWTGNGYNYYGWAGTAGTDVDGDPSLDNTWTDDAAYATEDIIPAGAGVWIIAEKAGTISFTPQF